MTEKLCPEIFPCVSHVIHVELFVPQQNRVDPFVFPRRRLPFNKVCVTLALPITIWLLAFTCAPFPRAMELVIPSTLELAKYPRNVQFVSVCRFTPAL